MNALNETLRAQAIRLGLCAGWQKDWSADRQPSELIDMFKRGQDFCISNDWPTTDQIRDSFTDDQLRAEGIFLDAPDLDLTIQNGTYIFLGESSGTVRFPRWSAAIIYLRHDSDLRIEAADFSRIRVYLHDSAQASPFAAESATIRIHDRR